MGNTLPGRYRGYAKVREKAFGFSAHTPFLEDLIVRDDLILSFLQLHQLAEFGRLAGLAFANDFGVWFKQADHLSRHLRNALEHSHPGLLYNLAYELGHIG